MQIKLAEIEAKVIALGQLGAKKLPVKLSYAVSKNKKVLTSELQTFSEARTKICTDNAEKDENGNPRVDESNSYMFPDDETRERVVNEVTELINSEIDVDILTVPIDVVEKCDNDGFDNLTASEMESIEFMIID